MRPFSGEETLRAWECSRELPTAEAALAVLALGWPERSVNELAKLPLRDRNALLLELRAAVLGRRMQGFAVCPECGAQLEFALDTQQLAQGLRRESSGIEVQEGGEAAGGWRMRPVDSSDLLASSQAADEAQARSILLARTLGIDEVELAGADVPFEALQERFEQINASAEIRLQLECTACRKGLWLDLDMARFLLRELAGAARRLMSEIHELAGAYGWSEQSIAAMSATRRAAYLEMLNA